jgi:hypothetical protein
MNKINQTNILNLTKKGIWLLFLVVILFPWQWVYACSPMIGIIISCSVSEIYFEEKEPVCVDRNCDTKVVRDNAFQNYFNLYYQDHRIGTVSREEIFINFDLFSGNFEISVLHELCDEDLSDQISNITQLYNDWREDRNTLTYFLIEPYKVNKEHLYKITNENLFSCTKFNYRQSGDWLLSYETIKEYCYRGDSIIRIDTCSWMRKHINPLAFIKYLFTNPTQVSKPINFFLLNMIISTIVGFFLLTKNKELDYLIFPIKYAFIWIVFFIPYFLIGGLILGPIQFLITAFGLYMIFYIGSIILIKLLR